MNGAIGEVYSSLNGQFRGDLLRPGHTEFSEARRIWNGMVARTPGLIARCAGVQDVQAVVRAASAAGISPAIRCGGHSLAGFSSCEGGLVIDLTNMRQVNVEETNRRARFSGGCLLGTVDTATQAVGLSSLMAPYSTPAQRKILTSFGHCAVAAETLAWSPSSK